MSGVELDSMIGRTIVGIAHIVRVTQGVVDTSDEILELSFLDGSMVRFDGGSDGETLVLSDIRWEDPFSPPLSPENAAYVEESGKLTRLDETGIFPASALVGGHVESVMPLVSPWGKTSGCRISTSKGEIEAEVLFDELRVRFVVGA